MQSSVCVCEVYIVCNECFVPTCLCFVVWFLCIACVVHDFIHVVCVVCGSKWCVCMIDMTYEFVYLCMDYDVCVGCMCVCKTIMHICGASFLCV